MSFSKIKYKNFRNLADNEVLTDAPVIFLIGNNGQGKTNFLEAVYYSCFGSSFRVNSDKYVIKNKADFAFIQGNFILDEGIEKKIEIKIASDKKEIKVDSKKIIDRKTLLENIPCIIFSHEDMVYVQGSQEKKRWFFNQTLCLFDLLFLDLLRNYSKILKNRNIILKEKKLDMIKFFDQRLAILGLEIISKRQNLVNEFNLILSSLFKVISGNQDELIIKYRSSWDGLKNMDEVIPHLKKNIKKDLQYMTSTSGPHRDTFKYLMNNHDFSYLGSTGQVRLVSLILKMAQAEFILKKSGKKPILLLDDVLLEMDYLKRQQIINNLPEFKQAFFTFLPNENFEGYNFKRTLMYSVENGNIIQWKKQMKF